MTVEWECLAFGKSDLPVLAEVNFRRKSNSALAYVRASFTYRRRGFPGVSQYLSHLQQFFDPLEISSVEESLRLARRSVVPLRMLGRLIFEDSRCLSRSVSLTAGLIALGLPAQLVIGRSSHYISRNYDFHAWTEVNGVPINDTPLVQRGYFNILRHPDW